MPRALPYLLSPRLLAEAVDTTPNLLVVCLGKHEQFLAGHLPGAVFLDPKQLNLGTPPAAGLLPALDALQETLRSIGLRHQSHVVCYDDEAGTGAARMMWVLEAAGHSGQSFLDGGLAAWRALGLPLEQGTAAVNKGDFTIRLDPAVMIDRSAVQKLVTDGEIESGAVKILDARTAEEHQGIKSASDRKGRIPGAVNLNWLDTIAPDHYLKSPDVLLTMLNAAAITRDSDIVVHCQTHQRSSHTFMMLRSLGFKRVRGYPGSWSDWAADPSTPIETGMPRMPGD